MEQQNASIQSQTVNWREITDEGLTDYLKNLTEADLLKERQIQAEKVVREYTTDEWKALRRLCKTDLFLLSQFLGFKKAHPDLHGHLCQWLEGTDVDQFREVLLPRGTYKSSIVTISDGVRIALPDDDGISVHPRNLGTNVRIAITHEIEKQAAKMLGSITGNFMSNPIIMGLFPECVPVPRVQTINTTQLELPRTEIWTEATFEAFNVGAAAQGRHFNFLKLDDLIGDKARDSKTIMQAAKDWFDNIQSFFISFALDHFDVIGTRWALDDLYAHIHKAYGDQLRKYIRGIEERNKDGVKVSIFPVTGEKTARFPDGEPAFPPEKLKILKQNKKIFSAQYANDPMAGAGEFEPQWKKFYTWQNQNVINFEGGVVHLDNCDKCILIDPAMSGLAGYIITAGDPKDNIFIVKAKKTTWKPHELVNEIFLDAVRWKPRVVVIEAVLFSEVFQSYIIAEQGRRDIRFRIEALPTRQKQKEARIRGLESYFQSHRIWMHEDQEDLSDEYDKFGATKDVHLLDALAQGPFVWRRGQAIQRASEIAKELASNQRDVVTGYSRYP